ncbi:MAG: hypothetical protein HWN68_14550 [Desulfobacterales bacterium]|nr:hypothetical protein [Desulfobacterales bacterium]
MGQALNIAAAQEDVRYASPEMYEDWKQKARDRGEITPDHYDTKPPWWMYPFEHDWKVHNWNPEYTSYVQGLIARAGADQQLMFWTTYYSGPEMRGFYGIEEEAANWVDTTCPSCGIAIRVLKSPTYQNFETYCPMCGAAACPEPNTQGRKTRWLTFLIGAGVLAGIGLASAKRSK